MDNKRQKFEKLGRFVVKYITIVLTFIQAQAVRFWSWQGRLREEGSNVKYVTLWLTIGFVLLTVLANVHDSYVVQPRLESRWVADSTEVRQNIKELIDNEELDAAADSINTYARVADNELEELQESVVDTRESIERRKEREKEIEDRKASAVSMCKRFMRRRLRSPSSASFPWSASAEHLGGRRYKVVSYVDAENGFGAEIRTDYSCIVRKRGGDSWALEGIRTW